MSVGNLGGTVEWDAGEQGKIAVDIFHDHVLILEGLDEVTMKRLREALRREVVQAQ
jgi:aryl carrier-like protein